jgi:hypothetical protein
LSAHQARSVPDTSLGDKAWYKEEFEEQEQQQNDERPKEEEVRDDAAAAAEIQTTVDLEAMAGRVVTFPDVGRAN